MAGQELYESEDAEAPSPAYEELTNFRENLPDNIRWGTPRAAAPPPLTRRRVVFFGMRPAVSSQLNSKPELPPHRQPSAPALAPADRPRSPSLSKAHHAPHPQQTTISTSDQSQQTISKNESQTEPKLEPQIELSSSSQTAPQPQTKNNLSHSETLKSDIHDFSSIAAGPALDAATALRASLSAARASLREELRASAREQARQSLLLERASRALVIRTFELDNRSLELDARDAELSLRERQFLTSSATAVALPSVAAAQTATHYSAVNESALHARGRSLIAREQALLERENSAQAQAAAHGNAMRSREEAAKALAADADARLRKLDVREKDIERRAEEQEVMMRAEREQFWTMQRALSEVVAKELDEVVREQKRIKEEFRKEVANITAAVVAMREAAATAQAKLGTVPHLAAAAAAGNDSRRRQRTVFGPPTPLGNTANGASGGNDRTERDGTGAEDGAEGRVYSRLWRAVVLILPSMRLFTRPSPEGVENLSGSLVRQHPTHGENEEETSGELLPPAASTAPPSCAVM